MFLRGKIKTIELSYSSVSTVLVEQNTYVCVSYKIQMCKFDDSTCELIFPLILMFHDKRMNGKPYFP